MTGPTLTDRMPAGKPDAEVDVDEELVRRLLESQHPDLTALPLTHLDSGWDNVLFRLGEQHLVRVPRRQIAAGLIQHEQKWLPELAPVLPIRGAGAASSRHSDRLLPVALEHPALVRGPLRGRSEQSRMIRRSVSPSSCSLCTSPRQPTHPRIQCGACH